MKSSIIAALAILILAVPASAGQIEYDVISDNHRAWVESDYETPADVQDVLDEAYAIANDTTADTYCETYASASAFIIATYQQVLGASEYDVAIYSQLKAAEVVYDEMARLADQCLNEA